MKHANVCMFFNIILKSFWSFIAIYVLGKEDGSTYTTQGKISMRYHLRNYK